MAAHPDKCSIAVIRVITVDIALVVSGANSVSVGDGGLLVHTKLVGEGSPEPVSTPVVIHVVPSEQAGLDSGHPLWVQSILANTFGNLAVKSSPFV